MRKIKQSINKFRVTPVQATVEKYIPPPVATSLEDIEKVSKMSVLRDVVSLLIVLFQIFIIPFHVGFEYDPHNLLTAVNFDVWTCFMILSDFFIILNFLNRRKKAKMNFNGLIDQLKGSSSQAALKDKLALLAWWGYVHETSLLIEIICFIPFDILTPLYAHIWGCGFMLIAHYECGIDLVSQECRSSWALSDNLANTSMIHQYARSYLWGILTAITIGLGDIVPRSDIEVLYSMFLFLWGFIVQNQIIANFCFFFSKSLKAHMQFDGNVDAIKVNLKMKNIPIQLQDRVSSYFEYEWKYLQGVKENDVIANLPPHIRRDAVNFLQSNSVGQVPLWKGRSAAFFSKLAATLKIFTFSPKDYITREDNVGNIMFVLHRGQAEKWEKKRMAAVIEEGNAFGELALFDQTFRWDYSVIALTFCEVYALSSKSFAEMLVSLYGEEEAADHSELMKEKFLTNNKSKGKTNKLLGRDDDEVKIGKHEIWKLPLSSFRKSWEVTVSIGFVYYIFQVPLKICFAQKFYSSFYSNPVQNGSGLLWFDFVLNLVISIVMMIDVFLYSRHFFFIKTTHTGLKIVIKDKEVIWHEYRRTFFALDLISSVPFFLLSFVINSKYLAYVSLLRLFRMWRGNDYLLNFIALLSDFGIIIQSNGVRMVKLLTQIFISIHITGCIFAFIGKFQDNAPQDIITSANYVWHSEDHHMHLRDCQLQPNCTWLVYDDIYEASIPLQYLRCIYWSSNIFSKGEGDIKPITTLETIYVSLWVYAGAMYFYMACGLISSFTEQWSAASNTNQDNIDALNLYMSMNKVPMKLRSRIRNYFRYLWDVQHGMDEHYMLSLLPKSLRENITCEMYENNLKNIMLFQGCASDFIKGLVGKLHQQVYLEGDYVVRDGDIGNLMFVINLGRVEIIAPDQLSTLAALCEGNYFGESSFFLANARRGVYVKAVSLCNLSELSKQDFEEVAASFPGTYERITRRAALQREADGKSNMAVTKNMKSKKLRTGFYMNPREGLYVRQVIKRIDYKQLNPISYIFDKTFHPDRQKSLYDRAKSKNQTLTFDAYDPFRMFIWNNTMLIAIGISFFFAPFRLAYLSDEINNSYYSNILIFDLIIDFLFISDIILKSMCFSFNLDGEEVVDKISIFNRYKKYGWFYYDLVSSIPLYSSSMEVMSIVRFIKALRIVQIGEYFDDLQDMIVLTIYPKFNSKILRITKLVLLSIAIAHFLGCIFFYISYVQLSYDISPQGWIQEAKIYQNDVSIMFKYTKTMYWSFEALAQLCFGDISSGNPAETIWATFCCLLGFVVISNVIGNVADIVATLNKAAVDYQIKVDSFLDFAANVSLPPDLKDKILQYYEFEYSYTKGVAQSEIDNRLPLTFKLQMSLVIVVPLLKKCWLFSSFNAGMLNSIANICKSQLCVPGDVVAHQGDVGKILFILNYGVAEVFSQVDNCIFATLHEGSVFGFVPFFLPHVRTTASMRTFTYCEFYYIQKDEWDELTRGTLAAIELAKQSEEYYHREKENFVNIRRNLGKATTLGTKMRKLLFNEKDVIMNVVKTQPEKRKTEHSKQSVFGMSVYEKELPNGDDDDPVALRRRTSLDRRAEKLLEEQEEQAKKLEEEVDKEKKQKDEEMQKKAPKKLTSRKIANNLRTDDEGEGSKSSVDKSSHNLGSKNQNKYSISAEIDSSSNSSNSHNDNYSSNAEKIEERLKEEKKIGRRKSNMAVQSTVKSHSNFPSFMGKATNPVPESPGSSEKTNRKKGKQFEMTLLYSPLPPHPWAIPQSKFREYWDILVSILVIYYAFTIPFRLCFMEDNDENWLPYNNNIFSWFVVEKVTDVIIFLHFVFNYHYFAFYVDGELRTNSKEIFNSYLQGWLIIDAIALLPFDYFATIYFPSSAYFSLTLFRINKLLFSLHLLDLFDQLEIYVTRLTFVRIRPSTYRIFKWISVFLMVNHFMCCLFYIIGIKSGGYGSYVLGESSSFLIGDGGWMSMQGAAMYEGETSYDVTLTRFYLRSYYFCLGAMTSVGYGDIIPLTYSEIVFLIIVIFISCSLLGSGIGVLRASLNDLYQIEANVDEDLRKLLWFLRNRNYEQSIIDRVKLFYKLSWQRHKGSLGELPLSLKKEVCLFVYYELVEKVDLFEKCEQGFVDAIVLSLKPLVLLKGDTLIKEGEVGNEMYFINSGILSVYNDAGTLNAKKMYGDYIGEIALLLDKPRNANVIAESECDLLVFTRVDYEKILKFYPEYREINIKKWIKTSHLANENVVKADSNILEMFRKAKNKISMINALSKTKQSVKKVITLTKVARGSITLKKGENGKSNALITEEEEKNEENTNNKTEVSKDLLMHHEIIKIKEDDEEEEEEEEVEKDEGKEKEKMIEIKQDENVKINENFKEEEEEKKENKDINNGNNNGNNNNNSNGMLVNHEIIKIKEEEDEDIEEIEIPKEIPIISFTTTTTTTNNNNNNTFKEAEEKIITSSSSYHEEVDISLIRNVLQNEEKKGES